MIVYNYIQISGGAYRDLCICKIICFVYFCNLLFLKIRSICYDKTKYTGGAYIHVELVDMWS